MFYFSKMHATRNDFVIINCMENKFEYCLRMLAKFLCARHYGVGADGMILIEESDIADFKMQIYNSDGSSAEMCGNGIRCFAKYVYEKGLIHKNKFKIETLAGVKKVELVIEEKTVVLVKVDMGKPILEYSKIPVFYQEEQIENRGIEIVMEEELFEVFPISIGNPHVVCFVEDVKTVNIKKIGPIIENYKYFPNKTNVEFVQIIDEKNIKVRVWERGVGETLSCGTGACAASVISVIQKSTESELTVDLQGGKLEILYKKDKCFLTGPATEVFSGEINI